MEERYSLPGGFTVVSGGQSGADRAGLDWAIAHGIPHAGWCPKGRRTEEGRLPAEYQLQETPSTTYLQRTEWNVRDSDATVVFTMTDKIDGGSKRTIEFAEKLHKPCLHFRPGVDPTYLVRFLQRHQVKILNIAGKRESSAPGISDFVKATLDSALGAGGRTPGVRRHD